MECYNFISTLWDGITDFERKWRFSIGFTLTETKFPLIDSLLLSLIWISLFQLIQLHSHHQPSSSKVIIMFQLFISCSLSRQETQRNSNCFPPIEPVWRDYDPTVPVNTHNSSSYLSIPFCILYLYQAQWDKKSSYCLLL